jgi:Ca2+-binding RTX toxin-like protein
VSIFAVEVLADHIKIEFTDGRIEEIEGGVYERKNSDGDTVEQRSALSADTDRLSALAVQFEADNPPSTAEIVEATDFGGQLEIKYADGTKEEISGGVYERKDSSNETIIERTATQSDIDRLTDLFDASGAPSGDDGTPDQGSGDAPGTGTPDDDDGTPDQGSGDAPGTQTGGSGSDILRGSKSDDVIKARGNDDDVHARGGDDHVDGGAGKDKIRGGNGDDMIDGGAGDDRIRGDDGKDVIDGGAGDDRIRGGKDDDTLGGGEGDDRVRGNGGDDVVNGEAGDDRLKGGSGNDRLDGGDGSDRYHGGKGADVFVFSSDGADDKIHDFQDGIDLIDVTAYGFSDSAEFLSDAFEEGGDVYVTLGTGDVLKIDDMSLANITADDFIF